MASFDTNISYLLKCAGYLYKQNKFESAEEIYKSVLQKEIKNEAALKGLGSCLYQLQKYENALRCFQALEKLYASETTKVWIYASLTCLGKTKEAKELIKQNTDIESCLKTEGIQIDCYL